MNKNSPCTALKDIRWGLIPFRAEAEKIGHRMSNARAETLREKPGSRKAVARRHCLVPADGFFQWAKSGVVKQPLRFVVQNAELLCFDGLWEQWKKSGGTELGIFTIIVNALAERFVRSILVEQTRH